MKHFIIKKKSKAHGRRDIRIYFWVMRLLEEESKKVILFPVVNRKEDTLIQIIR